MYLCKTHDVVEGITVLIACTRGTPGVDYSYTFCLDTPVLLAGAKRRTGEARVIEGMSLAPTVPFGIIAPGRLVVPEFRYVKLRCF